MNNCKCGKEVRLRATKTSNGHKRGIYHYIEHMDGTHACGEHLKWDCIMMKPYPKIKEDWPCEKMIALWNEENKEAKP